MCPKTCSRARYGVAPQHYIAQHVPLQSCTGRRSLVVVHGYQLAHTVTMVIIVSGPMVIDRETLEVAPQQLYYCCRQEDVYWCVREGID